MLLVNSRGATNVERDHKRAGIPSPPGGHNVDVSPARGAVTFHTRFLSCCLGSPQLKVHIGDVNGLTIVQPSRKGNRCPSHYGANRRETDRPEDNPPYFLPLHRLRNQWRHINDRSDPFAGWSVPPSCQGARKKSRLSVSKEKRPARAASRGIWLQELTFQPVPKVLFFFCVDAGSFHRRRAGSTAIGEYESRYRRLSAACAARAAPMAVLTSLRSSGGGRTAFIPNDWIQSSRHQPLE